MAAEDVLSLSEVGFYQSPDYYTRHPPLLPKRQKKSGSVKDWHVKWKDDEPEAGTGRWRTRNRYDVRNMSEMEDDHLRRAVVFASTKKQHRSKLGQLLSEISRRAG